MTYSREDMASTWWHSLSDQERRELEEQFERDHGGPGVTPPTALELFDAFNRGEILVAGKG